MEMQEEVLKVEEEFLLRLPIESPDVFIKRTLKLLKNTDPYGDPNQIDDGNEYNWGPDESEKIRTDYTKPKII